MTEGGMTRTEPSASFVFAGNRLDRQSENRAEDALERALAHAGLRVMGFGRGRVAVDVDGGTALFEADAFDAFEPRRDRAVWLGDDEVGPVVALPVTFAEGEMPFKAIDYRSVAAQGLLSAHETGVMAQGASLLAWHATHQFCSRCGTASRPAAAGYKRVCPNCEAQHFPRTDPVVIMLAVRGERCLMGRGHNFPLGMFSALAGFVEPGETIEDAVRRETLEESGIRIGRVDYLGNQPWPFPHTLMIGCLAEALDDEIDHDTAELAECRWFTRDEVRTLLADEARHRGVGSEGGEGFFVPPKMAIAHQLMKAWAERDA